MLDAILKVLHLNIFATSIFCFSFHAPKINLTGWMFISSRVTRKDPSTNYMGSVLHGNIHLHTYIYIYHHMVFQTTEKCQSPPKYYLLY